jgi:hypothetical protein
VHSEPKRREGYTERSEDEHRVVLVQVPSEAMPDDVPRIDSMWGRLELWMNETLGWTGLGRCANVAFSGPLTAFGAVVDVDRAVEVLVAEIGHSGLPDGTMIAVEDDAYGIRWPPEKAGDTLPD